MFSGKCDSRIISSFRSMFLTSLVALINMLTRHSVCSRTRWIVTRTMIILEGTVCITYKQCRSPLNIEHTGCLHVNIEGLIFDIFFSMFIFLFRTRTARNIYVLNSVSALVKLYMYVCVWLRDSMYLYHLCTLTIFFKFKLENFILF